MKRLRDQTLTEAVRDTPVRQLSPVEEELHAFVASLPPPPMTEARDMLAGKLGHRQSGHDLVETVLEETRQLVARQAAQQIADANAATIRAIAERDTERRKWWWARGGKVADYVLLVIVGGLGAYVWNVIRSGGHP